MDEDYLDLAYKYEKLQSQDEDLAKEEALQDLQLEEQDRNDGR